MSCYVIAQIKINDSKEYQKYLDGSETVFSRYRGKYLAVDEAPLVLEGHWNYDRTVVIQFESRRDFEDWYTSEEYQRILRHRLRGAECDTILVQGMED
jgi:uncharacterized protein (DUF1330 family)